MTKWVNPVTTTNDADFKLVRTDNTDVIANACKKISELEQQIEKMKCCGNCQTVRDAEGNCYLEKDGKCINLSKWELRK